MIYLLACMLIAVFLLVLWLRLRSWQKKEQAAHIVYLKRLGINAVFDNNGNLHIIRPENKDE